MLPIIMLVTPDRRLSINSVTAQENNIIGKNRPPLLLFVSAIFFGIVTIELINFAGLFFCMINEIIIGITAPSIIHNTAELNSLPETLSIFLAIQVSVLYTPSETNIITVCAIQQSNPVTIDSGRALISLSGILLAMYLISCPVFWGYWFWYA
ncbi:MAG: hypothetical protein GX897_06895 [Clostridiales bacterium]|nr:hypothetical protein [Clostridiales bacterium]